MTTKLSLLVVAAAAALLLVHSLESRRRAEPAGFDRGVAEGSAPSAGQDVLADAGRLPVDADPEVVAERTAGADTAPAAHDSAHIAVGELHVVTTRGDEPVGGVALVVIERDSDQCLHRVYSDDAGRARFDDVPPGHYSVCALRGPSKDVEVRAGEVTELRLDFKGSVTARGLVTAPDGRPVAGADVLVLAWRRDWTASEVVAHTDTAGRFEVPFVRRRCSIGATSEGFGPAPPVDLELVTVTDDVTEPITLVLTHEAGAVAGRVTGPSGAPIAGARVAVGAAPRDYDTRSDGTTIEVYGARVAETDAAGRYSIMGLPPGPTPVNVWARGLPIAANEVTVLVGVTVEHDVVLQRGLFVEGTVTLAGESQPLERAIVIALDATFHDPFPSQGPTDRGAPFPRERARTDAAGHYRLGPLAAGPVHLYAAKGVSYWDGEGAQFVGTAQTTLDGRDGETLRWDPALSVGRRIHGRITYADGSPLGSVFVSARPVRRDGERGGDRTEHAAEDGTFDITGLEDREYTVDVQLWDAPSDARPLRQADVRPSETPLLLVASYSPKPKEEPGRVRVRLVDEAGRVEGRGSVHFESGNARHYGEPGDQDGVFVADLPPGSYRPLAISGEVVVATGPEFELRPGESLELPDLRTFTPGTIEVVCERGTLTADVHLSVRSPHPWDGHWARLEGDATEHTFRDVRPGEWRVELWGMGVANASQAVDVVGGRTTRLVVRLEPAIQRVIEVTGPRPEGWGSLELRLTDEGASAPRARTVFRERWAGSLPVRWELMLPVGRFRVEARRDGQPAVLAELVVSSLEPSNPLTLVLP